MKGSALFNFISHIIHMGAASGKKRIAYAIANIAVMVLGVLCALGKKWSLGIMSDTSFIAGLLCLILCIALAIFTFLQGFVAQFALVIIAGIGIANPEERAGNIVAFIIALLTSVGLIVGGVIILTII